MISTKQTVYTTNQTAWGLYGVDGDVDEVDNWHSLKGLRLHELKGLELDSTLGGIGDSSNQGFKPTWAKLQYNHCLYNLQTKHNNPRVGELGGLYVRANYFGNLG